jgi:hypothetical protein
MILRSLIDPSGEITWTEGADTLTMNVKVRLRTEKGEPKRGRAPLLMRLGHTKINVPVPFSFFLFLPFSFPLLSNQ